MLPKTAFIGAGKMAEALIARLPQTIIATDINPQRIKYLKKKYGIKTAKNNLEAFNLAEIVILAVKPQNIAEVAAELALQIKKAKQDLDEPGRVALPLQNKLIISIAAGISIGYLPNLFSWFVCHLHFTSLPHYFVFSNWCLCIATFLFFQTVLPKPNSIFFYNIVVLII